MATKNKSMAKGQENKISSKPKRTKQGQGLHSKASHGRKKTRGQGRG
jgi:hypothetical protein